MAEKYITEEQRAKCRKVADAFAELYELTDVMVQGSPERNLRHEIHAFRLQGVSG